MQAFLALILIIFLASIALVIGLYAFVVQQRKGGQALIDKNIRKLSQLVKRKSDLEVGAKLYLTVDMIPFDELHEQLTNILADIDLFHKRLVEKRAEVLDAVPETKGTDWINPKIFLNTFQFWHQFKDKFEPVISFTKQVEQGVKEGERIILSYKRTARQVYQDYEDEKEKYAELLELLQNLLDAGLQGSEIDSASQLCSDLGVDLEQTGATLVSTEKEDEFFEQEAVVVERLKSVSEAKEKLESTAPRLKKLAAEVNNWNQVYDSTSGVIRLLEGLLNEIEVELAALSLQIDADRYRQRYYKQKVLSQGLMVAIQNANVKELPKIERGAAASKFAQEQILVEVVKLKVAHDELVICLTALKAKLDRIRIDVDEWQSDLEHPVYLDQNIRTIEKISELLDTLLHPKDRLSLVDVQKQMDIAAKIEVKIDEISDSIYMALSKRKDLLLDWKEVKDTRGENLIKQAEKFLESAKQYGPANWSHDDGFDILQALSADVMRQKEIVLRQIRQPNIPESMLEDYFIASDRYLGERKQFLERMKNLEEKLKRLKEARFEANAICNATGNMIMQIRNVAKVDPYLMGIIYDYILEEQTNSQSLYKQISVRETSILDLHKRIKLWDQNVHLKIQEYIQGIQREVAGILLELGERVQHIHSIAILDEEVVLNETIELLAAVEASSLLRLGEEIEWREAKYAEVLLYFSQTRDRLRFAGIELTDELETDLLAEYKKVLSAKIQAQSSLENLKMEERFSQPGFWPPIDVGIQGVEEIAVDCENALDALKTEGVNQFFVYREFQKVISRYQQLEEEINKLRRQADQHQMKIVRLEEHLKNYQNFFNQISKDFKRGDRFDQEWIELTSKKASHKRIQEIISEYQRGKIDYSKAYSELLVINEIVIESVEGYKNNARLKLVFKGLPTFSP